MLFKEKGLFRYENNPIITPADYPGALAVFNCGQTMYQGQTILLCAIDPANGGLPYIHVARSDDGIHFTFDEKPFITQSRLPHIKELDWWPIDPRVTYFPEEDVYYIMRPGNSDAGCVAFLGKTHDFVTYEDIDVIALPNNRVPCLFPEKINGMYYRLDRPYVLLNDPHNENQRGYIWISESPDLIHWGRHRILLRPWANWNIVKIGPTPPIKTKDGWLEIIHGVSGSCSGQRYSLGAVLLDLEDPTKVIGRCDEPLITPDREYEYMGKVPNVIFTCGAIADYGEDRLRVYYGAADTSIGLATGSLSEIIAMCKQK
ncbi:glycoside hydrolase family 130 protein [Ructibacterium gallinarum]|uniref:Glycoside hydrolase family 130 protein n=1 Tax=Ructibacterium gallinarum TaxID=2779355 RepID=A0A9D5M489_9FIRM|nr:glycoside hydrolase family 130 protein [Ructibacterium gallinarum]MBE5039152.1 glycoside hydrolase family 130 protein [Ructibacterium gallinarum]